MKEEQIRKILSKSKVETSDDFVDKVMLKVDEERQLKLESKRVSFRPVLISSALLILVVTFVLYQLLISSGFPGAILSTHQMPIFLLITFALLYYLNYAIRLNNKFRKGVA